MPEILKIVFALLTAAFGAYSFWQPDPVAKASGFDLPGSVGRAELRIAFGGFFLGLGLGAILLGGDDGYRLLGVAYLVSFALRLTTLLIEERQILLRPAFVAFGVFELISGLILFIPQ
jgi:hypothetical protein